jgi:hypothetical protein
MIPFGRDSRDEGTMAGQAPSVKRYVVRLGTVLGAVAGLRAGTFSNWIAYGQAHGIGHTKEDAPATPAGAGMGHSQMMNSSPPNHHLVSGLWSCSEAHFHAPRWQHCSRHMSKVP